MILTPEETEEAAARLYHSSKTKKKYEDLPDMAKQYFKNIVFRLAQKIDIDRTPESLAMFVDWMGDAEEKNDAVDR